MFGAVSVLIVDPSLTARKRLAKALVGLGFKAAAVREAASLADAGAMLEQRRSDIVLRDSTLVDSVPAPGVAPAKAWPRDSSRSIVVVSEDTSQAAVARALELGAEGYLIKPFTRDSLQNVMAEVFADRRKPSAYLQAILNARTMMATGDLDSAREMLVISLTLHPRPSLAESLLAEIAFRRKQNSVAMNYYKRALISNKIHWPSLKGLLELYRVEDKRDEMYEILRRIVRFYPAHADRLTQVLRLAVETWNFEDIEEYGRIHGAMGTSGFSAQQAKDMLSYVCAAMVVSGKYFLINKNTPKAMELFERAISLAPNRAKFLAYVMENLREFHLQDEMRKLGSSPSPSASL
jgi:DNA-binding response OmpR family regulator